jgi:hypothetical protein
MDYCKRDANDILVANSKIDMVANLQRRSHSRLVNIPNLLGMGPES